MSDRWRGIVALLLNADTRAVLAEAMASDRPLTGARRDRAIARLRDAGMVRSDAGRLQFTDDALRDLLAEEPAERSRTGVTRFLEQDGRIDRLPARPADRRELLGWVRERLIAADEVLPERIINERLAVLTSDVAGVRRGLVDEGLLERTRSGSAYAWPSRSGD